MQLNPVESSHIAAIGYLEADRVLLVRYKDGALYAFADVREENWLSLQMATSKGKWVNSWIKNSPAVHRPPGILLSKGGNAGNPSQPERHGAEQTAPLNVNESTCPRCGDKFTWQHSCQPLNVIDEDADPCCRRCAPKSQLWRLDDYVHAQWECPECGTQFYPELIGATRYWRIKSNVVIVRK